MVERLEEGQLPCKQAFALVSILGVEPLAVGLEANDAGIRISRCQLGLFGYGPKAEGKHKIVEPMAEVPERLAERLHQAAGPGGITCAALWKVADGLGVRRIQAAAAAEALGLRVSHCQLACFPRPWAAPPASAQSTGEG
jgi:hypothetical protein